MTRDPTRARRSPARDLLVKFEGCYHGHSDSLLAKGAGSGLATLGIPGSPGVTEGAARDTLTSPYNDLDAVRAIFAERGGDVAFVIVEPVAANMGVVPPAPGFLEGLRDLCDRARRAAHLRRGDHRVPRGVRRRAVALRRGPDLTVLGKIMGGGFPCAAFGGRRDVMEQLAPVGPVYQAGTLSGNPVAVAAGIAALELARDRDPYPQLVKAAEELDRRPREGVRRRRSPPTPSTASRLYPASSSRKAPSADYAEAKASDHERYARFFHHMLDRGVYLPPSGYEMWTLSTAHGRRGDRKDARSRCVVRRLIAGLIVKVRHRIRSARASGGPASLSLIAAGDPRWRVRIGLAASYGCEFHSGLTDPVP